MSITRSMLIDSLVYGLPITIERNGGGYSGYINSMKRESGGHGVVCHNYIVVLSTNTGHNYTLYVHTID